MAGAPSADRRGKHRNPNSIAALAVHRKGTQFGGSNVRTCQKCGRAAMRGQDMCFFHGGARNASHPEKRALKTSSPRYARAVVRRMLAAGNVPLDLVRTDVFQAVWRNASKKGKEIPKEEYAVVQACSLLTRELVQAWDVHVRSGDPVPWIKAVFKAKALRLV